MNEHFSFYYSLVNFKIFSFFLLLFKLIFKNLCIDNIIAVDSQLMGPEKISIKPLLTVCDE